MDAISDVATVREALERQREERDYAREGWNEALAGHQACGESLLECSARREAAEAEARQLRERLIFNEGVEQQLRERVRRLTEGLRWVEEMTAGRAGVSGIADHVRALLSANPPQGDAAAGSSPSGALNEGDLKIEPWGRGDVMMDGVIRNPRGVRITHLPTGTVAEWDEEKSQLRNREGALALLREKLASPSDGGGA
jgi:hypothetical protein